MEERQVPHEWDEHRLGGINWGDYSQAVPDPGTAYGVTPKEEREPWRSVTPQGDTLGGINWGKMRPGIQAEPDDRNVSQQFLDRINPVLDKSRSRNLGSKYAIEHRGLDAANNEGISRLFHNGVQVGHVRWHGDTSHYRHTPAGQVESLDVDYGHRHMTMKLLQEAHDFTNRANIERDKNGEDLFQGPAASSEINENSGPIVQKYNPTSEGFGKSEYALIHASDLYTGNRDDYDDEDEDQEDDESRWERLWEEGNDNQRAEDGAPCERCEGAGESRLLAVHGQNTDWNPPSDVPGSVAVSKTKAFREVGHQTRYGTDSEGNEHEFEYDHPNRNRLFHQYYPALHGYIKRQQPWNQARWDTSEEWVKPCESCGHLKEPGFPNHWINRSA
jgi:hypothetical protein